MCSRHYRPSDVDVTAVLEKAIEPFELLLCVGEAVAFSIRDSFRCFAICDDHYKFHSGHSLRRLLLVTLSAVQESDGHPNSVSSLPV